MINLKIILKGGLKSCCSTYSASELMEFTKHWFENNEEIHFNILDIEKDYRESDPIADLAYKHFKEMIFPLVYVNDKLVAIGQFPEKDECLHFISSPVPVTEDDILNAIKESINTQTEAIMTTVKIPDWVFEFHGHRCPAMPIGYRAGLAAMKKLGVERASNKELYLICENGPEHATACFLDGAMAATCCTYGKGNSMKTNYGKNAITLIDMKNKKEVRVAMNPEFQKKGLASEFVKLRSQKVEPKDIPPEITNPLIENILSMNDEQLFKIWEVHDSDFKKPKGTFNWHECDICHEVVFENSTRVVNGKIVCIPCFENR